MLRSNTRNVFVADNDGQEVAEFKAIQAVCQKIESRRVELEKTSGFEKLYHKVVAHYFGGMRRHFRALRPKLKPKASLAYVVGDQLSFLMVPIATAALLGEVAEAEGFKVVGRELLARAHRHKSQELGNGPEGREGPRGNLGLAEGMRMKPTGEELAHNRNEVMTRVFQKNYRAGACEVPFTMDEVRRAAIDREHGDCPDYHHY